MRMRAVGFVVLWAALIFATSCAVITQNQLFAFVDGLVGSELRQRFETFWGVMWIVVVKGWHVTEFAILTLALIAGFQAWRPTRRQGNIVAAALLATAFAASDEFHQTFVPGRGGMVRDVLIDLLGVGGVTLVALRRSRRNQELEIDREPGCLHV